MELKDVKTILTRIKVNYPTFVNDDYTRSEWYKELKDYSLDDVMDKLEQHFRSEQYGNSIPKVYFLTKYLTKEKEKGKKIFGLLQCNICHKFIDMDEYDNHFARCSSIDYLNKQSIKYFKKEIDKEKFYALSDEVFDEKYDKVLKYVLSNTDDENEINNISKYFETLEEENTLD